MHVLRSCVATVTAMVVVGVSAASASAASAPSCPWMNTGLAPATRAQELLAAMPIAEKIQMVTGAGDLTSASALSVLLGPNPYAASFIPADPALCIPTLVLNDATNGIGDAQSNTTAFPDSIDLAAAWDPALATTYGQVIAKEALAKGVNILLGPGVDIARNPLNGRNFEYAGEDPFLAGSAAAAFIRGVQSEHVIATVKHYALNDQETDRSTDSSDAAVRTMQEIDLPAFDMAVKAGVGAVMCSYNRINSVYACQNPYTLHTVLDGQFGFDGFVMSDWGATHSTIPAVLAGLDMEMPSPDYYGSALGTAIDKGEVPMAALDDMVYRVIDTMFRVGLFDHAPAEGSAAAAAHATDAQSIATADEIAEDGSVLLKNDGALLPLGGDDKTIALVGSAASQVGATLAEQGYGSGHVPEFGYQASVVSPQSAITGRAEQAGDSVSYSEGASITAAASAAAAADVAVVFINDVEIEGADRPNLNANSGTCSFVDVLSPGDCTYLGPDQNALVSAVAAANPHTIVVIQSGDPVAMPWLRQVQGLIDNWYPGQVDGTAIAALLFGDVDRSGHLPLTFPVSVSQDPLRSKAQYPGVMEPGDTVGPHSVYSEGLLVGYRWYDAKHITPLFPFGFGLSYTRFHFSRLRVSAASHDSAVARFTLTNAGGYNGADVTQAYVGMPAAAGEPPRQLKGFQKVWLAPGQSTQVTIPLPATSFVHWSDRLSTWVITPGRYRIYVGDSSSLVNLPLRATLTRRSARLAPGAY